MVSGEAMDDLEEEELEEEEEDDEDEDDEDEDESDEEEESPAPPPHHAKRGSRGGKAGSKGAQQQQQQDCKQQWERNWRGGTYIRPSLSPNTTSPPASFQFPVTVASQGVIPVMPTIFFSLYV